MRHKDDVCMDSIIFIIKVNVKDLKKIIDKR